MRTARMARERLVVQRKLTVGRADDVAEREADRVADDVARGGSSHSHGMADPLGGLAVDPAIEQRINRARTGGSALDDGTRSSMESALGADLSGVRIHHDAESTSLNLSLQARAFTTGSDIFFSEGTYRPGSSEGSHLLAHELAHVAQQGGSVQRRADETVHRAFDPGNPNPTSITAATRLTGGVANKGVFLLTGEGGNTMVAKYIDEDPRRAQMADEVLDTAGLNSSGAKPYKMDVGGALLTEIRRIAADMRTAGDDAGAKILEGAADSAEGEANGVVLMRTMGGTDLGDVLYGKNKRANQGEKDKSDRSGVDPVALLSNGVFHYNLGRLYVADGLLGSTDRFSFAQDRVTFNSKNLKVLANGQINTFDSDTVAVSYKQLLKSKEQDKSAMNWTRWLLEGGMVWDLGLEAPGGLTQDLVRMFDVGVRQKMFDELVASFKGMANDLDWSTTTLDFATFDPRFLAGIVDAIESIVADLDRLVASAKAIGAKDKGGGAIDHEAMEIKGEYLKSVLPDLKNNGGVVTDQSKNAGRAKALAMAEKIVKRDQIAENAKALARFDKTLLPVPQRAEELSAPAKFGRKFGRAIEKIGGRTTKSTKSKRAKQARLDKDSMDAEQTEQAYKSVKKMGGGSHRQRHAEFDLGMQHAILAMHGRAVLFANADAEIMKLQAVITDQQAVADQLGPYQKLVKNGGYQKAVADFTQVATGYSSQLTRKGDGPARDEMARAVKALSDDQQSFEAGVDYIERMLAKTG